ncbi:MAG: poly-beta,6-N-acetyl-D-glucosamine synthase [Gaiellaceae bacterium]|nr:poly-beta,6-N-acetyl-D-glucosamine synthase [Gaiellaceae bacterium]
MNETMREHQAETRRTVVALIPAHDEDDQIADCIAAVRSQAQRVVVVADNCTDDTEAVASAKGAEVIPTVGNTDKKAGALNQALALLLPELKDEDCILIVDADSFLSPSFVGAALERIEVGYGAVGGNFRGRNGGGLVGTFQRNEYARYARDVARLKGRCLVLTGTATLFRVGVLRDVASTRQDGKVYDTEVLTEDNELTLRLLHLGHRIISPKECTLTTEVMPTWRELAQQRLRWKRGALQNLLQYGWTHVTRRYWGRQLLGLAGVSATFVYLGTLAAAPLTGLHLHPFWLAISGLFALERAVTVRERGLRQQLLGAAIVVEMIYDAFLQLVQARAYADVLLGRGGRW